MEVKRSVDNSNIGRASILTPTNEQRMRVNAYRRPYGYPLKQCTNVMQERRLEGWYNSTARKPPRTAAVCCRSRRRAASSTRLDCSAASSRDRHSDHPPPLAEIWSCETEFILVTLGRTARPGELLQEAINKKLGCFKRRHALDGTEACLKEQFVNSSNDKLVLWKACSASFLEQVS